MTNSDPLTSPSPQRPTLLRRAIRAVLSIFPSRVDIRAHRRPLLLVLISALFGALIFHQNPLGILGWVALTPLFIALHDLRGKTLFWAILAFGFIWYYLSVFWLHTLIVFHWLIPLGVAVGSLYTGAYFILFAIPAAWCCRQLSPITRPWALAVCWTGVEYLRNFTDMAFPWNLLGHSQAPWNPVHMGLAAYGGVSLISFLMALFNATLAVLFYNWRHQKPVSRIRLVAIAIVPVLAIGFTSLIPLLPVLGSQQHWRLHVSIIQPGTSQLQKWQAMMGLPGDTPAEADKRWLETETLMLKTLGDLTREAAAIDEPQLIVMPESVFMRPGFPFASDLQNQLVQLAEETDADLFFGADNLLDRTTYDANIGNGQLFLRPNEVPTSTSLPIMPIVTLDNGTTAPDVDGINRMIPTVAAWHISRTGGLDTRVYNKMQLVPFGEQVPFIQGIEWLQSKFELAGIAGAYRPGLQNTLFEVQTAREPNRPNPPLQFGAVICFESTFSYLTRHLASAGANFICVLTNDSWYDPNYAISEGGFWGTLFRIPGIRQLASAGPNQHLVQSQFRAIETGRPIVRSANTGISAFINSTGKVLKELPYGESGFITSTLQLTIESPDPSNPASQTFFVRYGEWLGKLCLGIWASIICLLLLTRPKSSGSRFALHK